MFVAVRLQVQEMSCSITRLKPLAFKNQPFFSQKDTYRQTDQPTKSTSKNNVRLINAHASVK
jgi:hypothetical protein